MLQSIIQKCVKSLEAPLFQHNHRMCSQTTLNSAGWVVTHPVVVLKQWRFERLDTFLNFFAGDEKSLHLALIHLECFGTIK